VTKRFKISALLGLLLVIVWAIVRTDNGEQIAMLAKYRELKKYPLPPKIQSPRTQELKVPIPQVTASGEQPNQISARIEKLKQVMQRSKEYDVVCKAATKQILHDRNFVDIEYSPYKDFSRLEEMTKQVVNTAFAKKDFEYWKLFGQALSPASAAFKNGKDALLSFSQLDSCRERDAIVFLDNIFEAIRKYQYDKQQSYIILSLVFKGLLVHQGGYFTANDLIFFEGMLRKSMAQGILDNSFRDRLDHLSESYNNERWELEQSLDKQNSDGNGMPAIALYFRSMQEYGRDMSNLIREIFDYHYSKQ